DPRGLRPPKRGGGGRPPSSAAYRHSTPYVLGSFGHGSRRGRVRYPTCADWPSPGTFDLRIDLTVGTEGGGFHRPGRCCARGSTHGSRPSEGQADKGRPRAEVSDVRAGPRRLAARAVGTFGR